MTNKIDLKSFQSNIREILFQGIYYYDTPKGEYVDFTFPRSTELLGFDKVVVNLLSGESFILSIKKEEAND